MLIPHQFEPRDYQLPLLKALDSGYKRVVQVWHRRSGKDKVDFNYLVKEAITIPAQYYYFAPTYEQGRKIIWDNVDHNTGLKMLDHIPKPLIKRIDNTRMLVEVYCVGADGKIGTTKTSLIQVIGTEDPNKLVGTNPRIAVFTEYSLQNPVVWDYIAPIMVANGGVAIFNFTPRGKNHAHQLLEYAKKHPEEYFVTLLNVDDTKALDEKALESEKNRLYDKYKDYALFNQEYYISFDAPVQGSYYGAWLSEAELQNRITSVPYHEGLPVDTYWDLGVGDSTAIWFVQKVGKEIHIIDYLETSGEGLTYYIKELQKKGYVYGSHFAPHDIEVREFTDGKSRREKAQALGFEFQIAPNVSIEDGIDAARSIFNRCWFDRDKCDRGLNALRSYQKVYDEKNEVYKDRPLHNWASHGADAFRYFAVSYHDQIIEGEIPDDTGWVNAY